MAKHLRTRYSQERDCVVRDGEMIDAWNDWWIPRGTKRRPVAARGLSIISTLSEVINPIEENWDEELIRDNVKAVDACDFLLVPLMADMEYCGVPGILGPKSMGYGIPIQDLSIGWLGTMIAKGVLALNQLITWV
jgi:hypothetical protein